MDNQALTVFEHEGKSFQIIAHNNEPWFIGKEICDALGFANHRDALSNLSPHQKDYVAISDAIGRMRETTIISEGGLYKLTFRSRKPEAEQFTNKVVDEILPAIRKTGSYSVDGRRKLAPGSLDLDFIQQQISAGEEQKFLWNADVKNWRKLERRALRPLPEPKEEHVKALPAPKPQPTIEEAVMDVLTNKLRPGAMASARKISQLGNTFLRKAGSPKVWIVLEIFHAQGRVEREGDGRGALYGLSVEDEKGTYSVRTLDDAS